jgi:hypothetical protein
MAFDLARIRQPSSTPRVFPCLADTPIRENRVQRTVAEFIHQNAMPLGPCQRLRFRNRCVHILKPPTLDNVRHRFPFRLLMSTSAPAPIPKASPGFA